MKEIIFVWLLTIGVVLTDDCHSKCSPNWNNIGKVDGIENIPKTCQIQDPGFEKLDIFVREEEQYCLTHL